MVKFPVVKLNIAKKYFNYIGAKIYKDHPLAIRNLDGYSEYIKSVDSFFT